MISPEGGILDVNKSALDMLGYNKNELVGEPIQSIYAPDELSKMNEIFKKWKKTGKIQNEEMTIVTKSGNSRVVLLSADALKNANGEIIHSISVQRDITDRKKVENDLQYRLLFENLLLSISTTFINISPAEIDNGITDALKHIAEFVDVDRAYVFQLRENGSKMDNTYEWCRKGIEPQKDRLQDLSIDDYPFINNIFKRSEVLNVPCVAKLPKVAKVEKKEFEAGGVQSLICVPLTAGGKVIGFFGFDSIHSEKIWSPKIESMLKLVAEIISNGLERKRSDEALRNSESKLATIFNANPDITYLTDTAGNILDANPALLKLQELTVEQIKKKNVSEFFAGTDPDQLKEVIDKLNSGKEVKELEVRVFINGKEARDFEINAIPIKENGNITAFLNVARDITERKATEKALIKSEDRYRTISELISDFVYSIRVDSDGTQASEWGTETLNRILGMDHEELLKLGGWQKVIVPDDLPIVIKRQQDLAAGIAHISEYRVVAKDGDIRWVRDYGYPIWDENKKRIVRILGAAQDITEGRLAEEALRKSKERFQDIVTLLPEAIFETDINGNLTYANDIAYKMFSYTKKDMKSGVKAFQMIIPEDHKRIKKNIGKIMQGEKLGINEYTAQKKDGTTFPVLIHSAVIIQDGKPIGLRGIIMDITRLKDAEEALRESEQQFRGIADGSFDIIIMIDRDGTISYVSPAVERSFGYLPEVLVGKRLSDYMPKLEQPKIKKARTELLKGKDIEGLEISVKGKKDSLIYFEVNLNPIYKGGEVTGFQGIARDITDRKHSENEMKKRLMKFRLEEGEIYLVKERSPTMALEAFKELTKIGYSGLIISRTPQKNYNNMVKSELEFLWLTEKESKNSFRPDLTKIERKIETLPHRKIVFIDRLDYLVSKHGFKKVLMFIHHLKDLAVIHNYIIIVSSDPSTLNVQQLRLLEKEMREVEPSYKSKLAPDMFNILKYIYQQNILGTHPSFTDIGQELGMSKPTVRKKIRALVSRGFVLENARGRNKLVELTARGKEIFIK
jgi:PAS domain S-box-containing protein